MSAFDFYTPDLGPGPQTVHHGGLSKTLVNPEHDVMVRMPNWLGDAVMSLPALYQIRKSLGSQQKLYVLTREKLALFWQSVTWLDQVFSFPGKRAPASLKKNLRNYNIDSIVFPNSFGTVWDIINTGSSRRIGRCGRFRGFFLTDRLPRWKPQTKNSNIHQLTHYLEIAATVFPDIEWCADFPPLEPGITDVFSDLNIAENSIVKPLAMAPGAAFGPAKQWPLEYFIEVAKEWRSRGGTVLAVGTAQEKDAGARLAKEADAYDLCGKTSLPQLMAVLQNSSACLTNDSGTMHLAAALGSRGVAVFGSTNPQATGPVGGNWIVLKKTDCPPCFSRICERKDELQYTCLKSIKPEDVISALDQLM